MNESTNPLAKLHETLQLAPDAKTVRAIMSDHVQSMALSLAALPEGCQAVLAWEPDVQVAAVELLQAELNFRGSPQAHELLRDLAHAFAFAAVRISQLQANRSQSA